MPDPILTLASGSKTRASILDGAGIPFALKPSNVDEDSLKAAMRNEGMSVRDQVMALAEAKAVKVSAAVPGLVLGADQMMAFEDQALDKPISMTAAKERLEMLRGKKHSLLNGLVIAENGQSVWRYTNSAHLRMRNFSEAFLDDYLERAGDVILSSVGAYQLESLGVQLFSEIEGDYFSILGLPILAVLDYLRTRSLLPS